MSMINWDEFEHIHVIKKLKQILGAWWNIDVVFTDERGQLEGFDNDRRPFCNPAIAHLVNKEVGQQAIAELVTRSIEDQRISSNRYNMRRWDMAGFDVASSRS